MSRYRSNIIDNLDASHSLKQLIVVPEETVAIYKAELHVFGEKYRAYESMLAGGGGELLTSETTIPPSVTSGSASNVYSGFTTPSDTESSDWVGNTDSGGAAHTHSVAISTPNAGRALHRTPGSFLVASGADTYFLTSSGNPHSHTYGVGHTHTNQPAVHCHTMDHFHQVSGSQHSHQVNVPDHSHESVAGIYEPASAAAEVYLALKDPDGVETDLGSLGSGEFETELELQDYMMKKGVYTLTFTADAVARLASIMFCTVFLEGD